MRLRAFVLITAVTLTACSDTSGPDSINGTYSLRSVNGSQLPFALVDLGVTYSVEITGGEIVLKGNNEFSVSTTSRERGGSVMTTETTEAVGTWAKSGTEILFTVDGSGFFGTMEGGVLKLDDGAYALEYRR